LDFLQMLIAVGSPQLAASTLLDNARMYFAGSTSISGRSQNFGAVIYNQGSCNVKVTHKVVF